MILSKEQIISAWNCANAKFSNKPYSKIIKELDSTLKDNYAYMCKYVTDTGDVIDVDDINNYIKEHPEIESVTPRYTEVCYIGDLPDATADDIQKIK